MLKKRILSLMLALVLTAALALPALAEGEVHLIATPDDLAAIESDPAGSYRLTADLDMTGVDWTPLAFSGTLDGDGHSIFNLNVTRVGPARANTVDGNNKVYDSVFAGLFSTLTNATVKNLTLQGVDMDVESPEHVFIGAVAGYFKNASILNCKVLDARLTLTTTYTPTPENNRDRCNAGVGGMVGFGTGNVEDCEADVTLVFVDKCGGVKVEEFMGGVLSTGNVGIKNTKVTIHGYDECHGYVHNGGLVGMFYLYDKTEQPLPIFGCSVNGEITFFEDNTDRRAYCKSYIGERLSINNLDLASCTALFKVNEIYDYKATLRPEKCAEPALTTEIHSADCTTVGYTVHTCTVCGNTWRDTFVPCTHVPGEWVVTAEATTETSGHRTLSCSVCGLLLDEEDIAPHVYGQWETVREPAYGQEGLRQVKCVDCGQVLDEETLPALVNVTYLALDYGALELNAGDTAFIGCKVLPADALNPMVYWKSSNERVVTVDTNGTVHAVGEGIATVTAESADGFARSECVVSVKLTWRQWLTKYLLFGWAWGNK